MNPTRRRLLATIGATVAYITINNACLGGLDAQALAPTYDQGFTLDRDQVDAKHLSAHYLIIGASVTRLSGDDLREDFGPTLQLEAVDGRAFVFPDVDGGPTIWGVFMTNYQRLQPGDWLVIEMAHGGVDVDTNRAYLEDVVARLDDGVCLAVVAPHTYYGDLDSVSPGPGWPMMQWNADMRAMQEEVIAGQPCHALVDWDAMVDQAVDQATDLSIDERMYGRPMLYDGRHPTTYGARAYAMAIYQATHPL